MITRDFLLAGRAVFTVSTPARHYTFRVTAKEASGKYPPAWFVSLLTGPDNEHSYRYLGMLDVETGHVRLTNGSRQGNFSEDSEPVRVVRIVTAVVYGVGMLPDGWTVANAGKCGRCGRALTTPESIARGLGPECVKKGR